jgi:hypothetical protein
MQLYQRKSRRTIGSWPAGTDVAERMRASFNPIKNDARCRQQSPYLRGCGWRGLAASTPPVFRHQSAEITLELYVGFPGQRLTDGFRTLGSAALVVLLLTGASNAAEPNIRTVSANPSKFDHQRVAVEGAVSALFKQTSFRTRRKEMTFTLRSLAGCGSILVYAQEPIAVSNGDHIR